MDETTNYGLNKPSENDYVDIEILNKNMDIIDTELAKKVEAKEDGKISSELLPDMNMEEATISKSGLMSAEDKEKLDKFQFVLGVDNTGPYIEEL